MMMLPDWGSPVPRAESTSTAVHPPAGDAPPPPPPPPPGVPVVQAATPSTDRESTDRDARARRDRAVNGTIFFPQVLGDGDVAVTLRSHDDRPGLKLRHPT